MILLMSLVIVTPELFYVERAYAGRQLRHGLQNQREIFAAGIGGVYKGDGGS